MTNSRTTAVVSAVCSTFLPLLSLCLAFEYLEPLVPEFLEERLDLVEPFWARSVEALRAVASLAHQSSLLQDVQMLRDRRPRHVEMRRDLAGGELAVTHEGQDPTPVRRCDRFQRGLHGPKCKPFLT